MNWIGLTIIVVTTSAMTIAFETVAVSIKSPQRISELSIVLKTYYYIVTTLSILICIFLVKIFLLLKFAIARASDRGTLGVKRVIGLFLSQIVNSAFLIANVFIPYNLGKYQIIANMT